MDIAEAVELQNVLNKNLVARIDDLERKSCAELSFVTDSLAFAVAVLLAKASSEYRDCIIAHCDIEPPDHLDKEAVAAGFRLLTDFLKDPYKKNRPDWFVGVISGASREAGGHQGEKKTDE